MGPAHRLPPPTTHHSVSIKAQWQPVLVELIREFCKMRADAMKMNSPRMSVGGVGECLLCCVVADDDNGDDNVKWVDMLCDRRKRRKTVEKLVRCDCGKAMKMFQTWHTIDFSLPPMHYFKHKLCFSSNHLVGIHFELFFSKILKTHKLISINFLNHFKYTVLSTWLPLNLSITINVNQISHQFTLQISQEKFTRSKIVHPQHRKVLSLTFSSSRTKFKPRKKPQTNTSSCKNATAYCAGVKRENRFAHFPAGSQEQEHSPTSKPPTHTLFKGIPLTHSFAVL